MNSWAKVLSLRLRSLFRNGKVDTELDREISFHVEMLIQQNKEAGMTDKEARNAALREFGNVDLAKENCKESWGIRIIEEFIKDTRFGFRQVAKHKIHTAIIIVTLAVCMGANTTAYNFVVKLITNPYEYVEADRIVKVGKQWTKFKGNQVNQISVPHFKFFEEHCSSFVDIGFIDDDCQFDLRLGDRIRRISIDRVTPGVWTVTGIKPVAGRFFTKEDVEKTGDQLVVLSETLWRQLRSDSNDLIGEKVILDNKSYQIIGVAPKSFYLSYTRADAWTPRTFSERELRSRHDHSFMAIAKLKPGISVKQADQGLKNVYEAYLEVYPGERDDQARAGTTFGAVGIEESLLEGLEQISVAFKSIQYVTLLVLVIGCLNVGGMIVVKGYTRMQELAMRRTLGASTFRLGHQLMVEIGIYFLLGGLLSLFVLKAGFASSRMINLDQIPWTGEWSIDTSSLLITLTIVFISAIATSILPLLSILKRDLMEFLKTGSRTMAGDVSKHRIQSLFIVSQVSLSVILLAAAGVSVRNLHATLQKDKGFATEGRIAFEIPMPDYRFASGQEGYISDILPLQERILERIRSMPGVISASASNRVPSSHEHTGHSGFSMSHYELEEGERHPNALRVVILPGYFETVDTRILLGRGFEKTDTYDSEFVVIISQNTVERFYEGLNPIGMMINFWDRDLRIVRVAEQVQEKPYFMDWDGYSLYFPYKQWASLGRGQTTFVAHVKGDPKQQLSVIEKSILDLDPSLTPKSMTFQEVHQVATFAQRLPMIITAFFSGLALLLTGLGLYGLISFTVAERTKEYGIRMALGARQSLILKRVMANSGRLISWGLTVGIVIAFALCAKLNPFLVDIDTTQPATFLVVATFVLLVSALATLIPAQRAMRLNITKTLQHE